MKYLGHTLLVTLNAISCHVIRVFVLMVPLLLLIAAECQ